MALFCCGVWLASIGCEDGGSPSTPDAQANQPADSGAVTGMDVPVADTGPTDTGADVGFLDAETADAGELCGDQVCGDDLVCLGEQCSCIKAIHGSTYLRTDGIVVGRSNDFIVEQNTETPLSDVEEIFDGHWHGCGRRGDGTVWCWATNASNGNLFGQLGRGTTGGTQELWQARPVLVEGEEGAPDEPLGEVVAITTAASRCYIASTMCAIRQDGTLWCWGEAGNGGGGSVHNADGGGNKSYATQVLAAPDTPLTDVDQVSVGTRHACVLRGAEVWCWATNVGGALGLGDQNERIYPTKVDLPGPARQVGAGSDMSCALVSDRLYCWGSNNTGQVGIGPPADTTDGCINFCKLTPTEVIDETGMALTDVVDFNLAYLGVCARRQDNSLWCWGGGLDNVAAPISVQGTVIDNVVLHTSCGSGFLPGTLVHLSRANELRGTGNTLRPQICP